MKWDDAYIILMEAGDELLLDFANALKLRYNIPPNRCLANTRCPGYTTKWYGFLSQTTQKSKVIIVSHANEFQILSVVQGASGAYTSQRFAHLLATTLGLRQVGLITFKGCNLGSGRYLDEVCFVLSERYHVQVGWLAGYKAGVSPIGSSAGVGILDTLFHSSSFLPKFSDAWRVKIVKGNIPTESLQQLSSRYHT